MIYHYIPSYGQTTRRTAPSGRKDSNKKTKDKMLISLWKKMEKYGIKWKIISTFASSNFTNRCLDFSGNTMQRLMTREDS